MKLTSNRRIVSQDFSKENKKDFEKIATIFNQFMDEVIEFSQNRIDFDNLNQEKFTLTFKVDGSGIPTTETIFSTKNISGVEGVHVINVEDLDGSTLLSTAPYIVFSIVKSNTYKIEKLLGVTANVKYRVRFIAVGK